MKYYVEWKLSNGSQAVIRTDGSMLKKDAELIETLLWNYVPVVWVEVREDKTTS